MDWDGTHPLNRSVDWSDVLVASARPVDAGREASALLETTEGALVVALPGTALRVVTGFSLDDSNLPLRLAFPIFFANVMQRAFSGGPAEGGYVPTGGLLTRTSPPGATGAKITDPSGRIRDLPILPGGTVTFTDEEYLQELDIDRRGDLPCQATAPTGKPVVELEAR